MVNAAQKSAANGRLKVVKDGDAKASPAVRKAPPTKAARKGEAAPQDSSPAMKERATKAAATRAAAEASGERRVCDKCGIEKAITSFPTTGRNSDGVVGRGKKCRACRDLKTEAK